MEKQQQLIGPYEKEYMKMAMLKHEETFKEQVYELHRLYQIQKILMKSREAFGGNTANSNSFFHKKGQSKSFNGVVEAAAEESQIELTLGLGPTSTNCKSTSSSRPKKLRDLNMHFITSDSTTSFSTSSTGSTRSRGAVKLGGSLDGVVVEKDSSTERIKHPSWIFQVLRLNST